MKLETLGYGSVVCPDDPGEPTTGKARISVTKEEARFLAWLARGLRVLEIGTGLGVSTRALALTANHIVTMDPDPWVWENIWPSLPKNVSPMWHRGPFAPTFQMVFIDGAHETEYVQGDLAFTMPLCPHGIIVVHDAKIDKVRAALDDSYALVDTYHGMAVKFVGWD